MSMARPGAGEEGYILHARPWRDTSLLLEVILRDSGRRGVIARGARSNTRQRGRLQPFRPLWLELGGRSELAQLRAVEEAGGLGPLTGRALACGYYLNELIMRLLPRDDPHPIIFDHYAEALGQLAGGLPEAPALRRFEKHLLEELGWAPDWMLCEDGTPIDAQGLYHVAPESGIRPALGKRADTVSGTSLQHLADACFDEPATAREIRLILHGLMAPHLGTQPLRSRELLNVGLAVSTKA